jgi:hypothetical protein
LSRAIDRDSDVFVSLPGAIECESDASVTWSVAVERREDDSDSFPSAMDRGRAGSVGSLAATESTQEVAEALSTRLESGPAHGCPT